MRTSSATRWTATAFASAGERMMILTRISRRTLCGVVAATLMTTGGALQAQDIEARAQLSGRTLPRAYFERVRQDPTIFEVQRGWTQRTAGRAGVAVTGNLRLIVVQALFSDSPEPGISAAEIQRALFDGPTPYGTLTEFYREISGGRLEVTGTVTPWVRTRTSVSEAAGSSMGLGGDARVGSYLLQALASADSTVDFGQFDNDGPDGRPNSGDDDGYVDAVAFQYIERSASCGGPAVWPHRSRVSGWPEANGTPYRSNDRRPDGQPVLVNDYIIQSTADCGATGSPTASVIAHELGHVLGLPDIYDSSGGIQPWQRRWVLGCWTLMAAGAWGCGDGSVHGTARRPSHMGPWEKAQLGWLNEQPVGEVRDHEFVLGPVASGGSALRVPLSSSEYLHIEYRPNTGFDADLPAGGVLIYHVDPARSLRPCATCPRIYRIALEEADGDDALQKMASEGGNRGVAGDVWGLQAGGRFSNVSMPAATLNSGAPSTVTLHSVQVMDGVARVRLSTAARPALVSEGLLPGSDALSEYADTLRAAGGALPYQWSVVGVLPHGISVKAEGESFIVDGKLLQAGRFPIAVQLRDALGTLIEYATTLTVGTLRIQAERLLQPFLRSATQALTPDEKTYLDQGGNRNGRYDVGDLRAHLLSSD